MKILDRLFGRKRKKRSYEASGVGRLLQNWTEAASYGTAQTFSGSVKMVKLGKTTVTSGTQVAMKAVWANQSSGSMETCLNGWTVNY